MAATGLSAAAVAQPMAVAAERGDLALVPYYTVRDQWVTGIHIVNTSDYTQVVKFRVRRATDGMDALDFNIVMSPRDVYAGFLSDDENGAISWSSPDTTCTVPAAQANRLTMPPIYRVGAESGYVEIIAMGQAETEQQPIAVAARHSGATLTPPLTPLDCAAVRSNFFADGRAAVAATTGTPAVVGRRGVVRNSQTFQPGIASASNPTVRRGGTNTYTDSGNVLKVSYFIRDNATGIEFGDNAVHIADFLGAPSITNQEFGLIAGDLNGFDFPDLDGTGLPINGTVAPNPNPTIVRGRFNLLRRTDVLGVESIINEWSVNPANGVEMDWVVTLPGQYLMLRLPQYLASLGADRAWVPTISRAGSRLENPKCPRRAIAANPVTGAAAVPACDFRDQPVQLEYTAYNREEFKGEAGSTLVVSPQAPVSARTYLPKVANVITFGGKSVLGQSDANVNASLGQPFGWVEAQLRPQSDLRVCQWDRAQDNTARPRRTVSTAAGRALSTTCSSATGKVPVIGFAAWSRKVAANPNASYGRIVEHSYRVLAPGAPSGLTATPGKAQVALSWSPVPGARRYTVYYSRSPIGSLTAPNVTAVEHLTTTSHTVTNLPDGTLYYFRVVASNAGGESPASAEASATTAPGMPTGLRATPGNAQVALSWTAVPGAMSYKVYYSTSTISDLTKASVKSVSVTGATMATIPNLPNGTPHFFKVTAINAGGESTASTEATATPQLPAPTGLRLARGNAEVAAVWAQVPNATGYRLYYATTSLAGTTDFSNVRFVDISGGSMITTLVTGLTNDTLYYFRVIATSAGHQSAASAQASATPQLPAPVGLTVTPGNAQVAANWLSVPNATGYKLYYSTTSLASTTNFRGVAFVSVSVSGGSTTRATATVTGLTNGRPYYFVVVATTSAGGESEASTEATATPRLPAPIGLRLARGNAEVAAVWSAVPNATGYRVYYSTTSLAGTTNFSGVRFVDVSGNSTITALVTGLPNGTVHYFRVVATSAGHESAASPEASATPQLPAPIGLTVTPGHTEVAANWLPVPNATGYKLYYWAAGTTGSRSLVTVAGTSATVTGLTNGTIYHFVVVATRAGGESAASTEARAAPRIPDVGGVFRDTLSGGGQGPQMVVLPTGSFRMGSPSTETGRDIDEGPVRTVTISQRIAMGRYEVTFADYDRFVAATSGRSPRDSGWGRGRRPVINVSQEDAQAYATWLSTQTGKTYRLPSEAEWEYGARARTRTRYSWGDGINCGQARYGRRPGGACSSSWDGTVPVGSFAPNGFGLFDMHGNVNEWVEDCYIDNYTNAPTDGSARTSGCDTPVRAVVRGGSWLSFPRSLRAANRVRLSPSNRNNNWGFRLVRDLTP